MTMPLRTHGRVLLLAGVLASAAACGSDTPTGNADTLAPAQLAMHFDTLAGQLQASHPGDVRLTWYQQIAQILARGAGPSGISATLQNGFVVIPALSEIDAFPDTLGGNQVADSTYTFAAWTPTNRPTLFVSIRVNFFKAGAGQPDTTASYISVSDSTGVTHADGTAAVSVNPGIGGGACAQTTLVHLTVPTNPCTKLLVTWQVTGGNGTLRIDQPVRIQGIHLTSAQ